MCRTMCTYLERIHYSTIPRNRTTIFYDRAHQSPFKNLSSNSKLILPRFIKTFHIRGINSFRDTGPNLGLKNRPFRGKRRKQVGMESKAEKNLKRVEEEIGAGSRGGVKVDR